MFNKNDGTKAFKPVGRLRVFFALPFYTNPGILVTVRGL